MGIIKSSGIDWEGVRIMDEYRNKLRILLRPLFEDEDNGDYEVIDYFEPPEEGHDAKCDFCGFACMCLDKESMLEHLLDDHISQIKIGDVQDE